MKRSWLLGGALACSLAAYVGCTNDSDVVAQLDGGLDSAPPSFTRDAGSDGEAKPEETLACIGTECPYPFATCPTLAGELGYKCENNLLTDNNNCGVCGNVCPPDMFGQLHMATRCVSGACQRECIPDENHNFKDCNGQVDDGCESDISFDDENCGNCGNKCPAGQHCREGKCGCPAGQTDCGDEGCRDTSSDDFHCGGCGRRCEDPEDAGPPPPHMEYGCSGSVCGQLRCENGYHEAWANCDGEIPNTGCEINTATDPNNCGTCGHKCAPGQICLAEGLKPPKCACDPGQTLCGSDYQWCADLLTDPNNCGACGHQCAGSLYHGSPMCRKGFCDHDCEQGWGDCDGDPENGCETNLMINAGHCGACGNRCDTAAGQPCIAGACLMTACDGGVTK